MREFISVQFVYFDSIVYSDKLDSPEVQSELKKRAQQFENVHPGNYEENAPMAKKFLEFKCNVENGKILEVYENLDRLNGNLDNGFYLEPIFFILYNSYFMLICNAYPSNFINGNIKDIAREISILEDK